MSDDLDPRPFDDAGPLADADSFEDAGRLNDDAALEDPSGDGLSGEATSSEAVAAAPSLPAGDASLLALVDRLAGLLERSDLLELEVEAGDTAITLRKAAALAGSLAASPAAAAPSVDGASPRPVGRPAVDPAAAPVPADAAPTARATVVAPLTGIFYASPTPGSPPFVEVGREVIIGQVIGLIEAMKLFNEIKSDKAGRVVRVVPENGALVKAKQPLIEVEPL
jgi:acetyl-CoA carboxylase biotin carboxyl carrier protein